MTMTRTHRSMETPQVRTSTKWQQSILWLCVSMLIVLVVGCGTSPSVLAQEKSSAQAEIDKFCAKHGTDVKKVDAEGNTLLHFAARCNTNPDVLKLLLDKGANVNAKKAVKQGVGSGETPLHFAKSNTNPDVMKLLLDNGAN